MHRIQMNAIDHQSGVEPWEEHRVQNERVKRAKQSVTISRQLQAAECVILRGPNKDGNILGVGGSFSFC